MALVGVRSARGTVNRLAAEAIAVNLLVQTATVGNSVILCPAGGVPLGVAYDAVSNAAFGDFQLVTPGDCHLCVASATIAIGDFVKAAASGQVAPEGTATTRTALTIGTAKSAASTSGVSFFVEWE